jgi:hypothetical protein
VDQPVAAAFGGELDCNDIFPRAVVNNKVRAHVSGGGMPANPPAGLPEGSRDDLLKIGA